ncbi:MAG TPA: peptide ABC transporter substrate-binding protein [Anaerolineaceae bacterium]|nr:peptide ABC transporter substrate-binding protein [Anaerolineaceae bacterium]
MKKLRWQLIIIFLTGLVVGVLLLAEQQPTTQVISTPAPEQGGVYTEALIGSMQRLNPMLDFANPVDRDVDRLLFSRLITFDSRGIPQPELAETWNVSKDMTVYNVAIKSGVKWHDGRPLTADDIIFTIDLLRAGGTFIPADVQAFWKEVDVQAFNDTNLQFKLPEAFSPFLDYLNFGVLPKHIYGDKKLDEIANMPDNLHPVGSGPYQFDRLVVENDKITGVALSVFGDYYGKKPFIEQVIFRYYPDGPSAYKSYQDGIVQGIGQVTDDILPAVLADPALSVYSARRPEMAIVLLNEKDPQATFLKDPIVRRALMEAINRQALINKNLNGQAIIADGPIFPGTWAFYEGNETLDYAPDQALSNLKNAGYTASTDKGSPLKKGDQALTFELIHPDDATSQAIAKSIQKDWAAIGVKVQLTALSYQKLVADRLDKRSYQAALVNMNFSSSPDPDPYPFWDQAQATGGQNYTQWDNRMASEFLEQARTTTDIAERIKLYRNFQLLFTQDMPAIPLYYPIYSYAIDHQIQGARIGPLYDTSDRFTNIVDWFLVSKKVRQTATETPAATQP